MFYVITVLILIFLFIIYMIYKAHHDTIDYRFIYDARLPSKFNGFRIFFISDIHRRIINQRTLNSIKNDNDIIIIGGDLTEKGVPIERTKHNIKKLKRWNIPIYFVWGNNDYESYPERIHKLLLSEGVIILTNSNKDLNRDNQTLSLLGLDCCKYRVARFDLANQHANGDYSILVTHAPSAFYELDSRSQDKIHTVLAGHTHGGQIRILGFGFYRKGGLNVHRQTNVFVSEGYGYTRLPFRLETKAECHVITFKKPFNKSKNRI